MVDEFKEIKELADLRREHPLMFFIAEFFFYAGLIGLIRNLFFADKLSLVWMYFICFVFTIVDYLTLQFVEYKLKK